MNYTHLINTICDKWLDLLENLADYRMELISKISWSWSRRSRKMSVPLWKTSKNSKTTPTQWCTTLTGWQNVYCQDPVKVKTLIKRLYLVPQNKTNAKVETDSILECWTSLVHPAPTLSPQQHTAINFCLSAARVKLMATITLQPPAKGFSFKFQSTKVFVRIQ